MIPVNKLFHISYGNSLELVALKKDKSGINFVSRTSKNNGVSGKVKQLHDTSPFPSGLITVAVSGNPLESFLQLTPFYTAFHVMVLKAKEEMTTEQKLFYCLCLRLNKYKYSFGRQANRTLEDILVPELTEIPTWINDFSVKEYAKRVLNKLDIKTMTIEEHALSDKIVRLIDLFTPINGIASSQVKRYPVKFDDIYLPYIRPSNKQETSIDAFVRKDTIDNKYVFPKGTLYVSTDGQGSHTFAYVSVSDFVPNSNVTVLIPKREMSLQEKLYYAHCITKNRYKFAYARKPKGNRLKSIMLPECPPKYIVDYKIENIINNLSNTVEKL